jgi:hypothetical protein
MTNVIKLDILLSKYFKQSFSTLTSDDKLFINLIVIILRLIHISGIVFLFGGFLFPNKYRDYHIIFCFKTLILWYIFDGKCYLTMLINYIKGVPNDDRNQFLPMTNSTVYSLTFFVLTLSIYGFLYPEYSPFNLLKDFINGLENQN